MAKSRPKERGSINGAFSWRLIEMLESPAHRALSLSARRILDRLEIEFHHHGGNPEENGRLPCTFDHFADFGIERHGIAPALRELVALGFVEITQHGRAGKAGHRQPTLFRLTYRHWGSHQETTDEWRRIKTGEEAEAMARKARLQQSERVGQRKFPSAGNPTEARWGNPTENGHSSVGKPHYGFSGVSRTTSISWRGTPLSSLSADEARAAPGVPPLAPATAPDTDAPPPDGLLPSESPLADSPAGPNVAYLTPYAPSETCGVNWTKTALIATRFNGVTSFATKPARKAKSVADERAKAILVEEIRTCRTLP
jgi:hypothetical protein